MYLNSFIQRLFKSVKPKGICIMPFIFAPVMAAPIPHQYKLFRIRDAVKICRAS